MLGSLAADLGNHSEPSQDLHMLTFFRMFFLDEAGQGLVEYALIIALISIVAIAGMTVMRDKASNTLYNAANTIK